MKWKRKTILAFKNFQYLIQAMMETKNGNFFANNTLQSLITPSRSNQISSFLSRSLNLLNLRRKEQNYLLQSITDHSNGVNCLTLSEDHSLLVSGGEDAIVRLWSALTNPCECIGVLSGHTNYITCCTVYRYLIISGSADCTLRIWRIEDGICLMILRGHQAFINRCITYGNILLSSSFDNTVRVWSLTEELNIYRDNELFNYERQNSLSLSGEEYLTSPSHQIFTDLVTRTKLTSSFGKCLFVLKVLLKSTH